MVRLLQNDHIAAFYLFYIGHPPALWADVAFCPFGQFSSFWMEVAASGMANMSVLSLGRGTGKAVGSRLAGRKHRPRISYQNSMSSEQAERTGEGNQQAEGEVVINSSQGTEQPLGTLNSSQFGNATESFSFLCWASRARWVWEVSETRVVA